MLETVVFELVQQFYHAKEFGNVAYTVSASADQSGDKTKTNYLG